MDKKQIMKMAAQASMENIQSNGGPFGAVIVRNGEIIATGVNRVVPNSDPTAHAEVEAIRAAAKKLKTFDLSDCEIFTSCEPCPMCLGAIYWAKIKTVYYSNTRYDAASIGFDDNFIYEEISKPLENRFVQFIHLPVDEARKAFEIWNTLETKNRY
ncbi:MAG TPA: nucleoside deaminase [Salinivirgaceae bacterium]|nr:nucleoside deaminase [Salinivirgaceae bacterium]